MSEPLSTSALAPPDPRARLPLSTKLVFGLPSVAGAAIAIPIAIHMPIFYSDVVLVPLGWLAIGIATARAFDAITDPLMGWISDRTRTRFGRRRPWIALGVPLCALALVALFSPPASLGPQEAIAWFAISFILYFLFHTVYEIPHYGLGAELTLDYHERSSLFGIRSIFIMVGVLLGTLMPGFLESAGGLTDRRDVFAITATTFATMLVVFYGLLLWRIRERPEFSARPSNPLVPGVRRAMRNRPFRILLVTYAIASIPGLIPATLMPFYTQYVLQVDDPSLWLTIFLAAYFSSGMLFLAIWIPLARRIGKLPVWLLNFVIGITGGFTLFFMGPGDEKLVIGLLIYTGSQFGAGLFLGPSMQADVIDYDELHTGKRREAQYGAFWSLVTKLIVIPSAAVPLAVLGAMGYAPNQPQAPEVVFTIKAIFGIAPASFSLVALLVAWRYPISERVHRQILSGILRHGQGESAVDPLTGQVVPPPRGRVVSDDIGWFLDHFTPRELRDLREHGSEVLLTSVLRKCAMWSGVALLLCGSAVHRIGSSGASITEIEKLFITFLIVSGGVALSGTIFHVMRIGPARRLRATALPDAVIRDHLAQEV